MQERIEAILKGPDTPIQVLTHQAQEDLWFNAVKITKENYRAFLDFSNTSSNVHRDSGAPAFIQSVNFYNNPNTTVFAVFASAKPYSGDLSSIDIEMYVTATTSTNAVFGAHAGIQRIKSENYHEGLSMLLHKFAACVITKVNPNAVYMASAPTPTMRIIMQKHLDRIGKKEAFIIDTPHLSGRDEWIVENTVHKLSTGFSEKQIKPADLGLYYLSQYRTDRKIFPSDFPKQLINWYENKITLPNGDEITITPEQRFGEFAYYFKHSCHRVESDLRIVVDYEALASLDTVPFELNFAFLSEGELVPASLEYAQIVEKHDYGLEAVAAAPAAAAAAESDDIQDNASDAAMVDEPPTPTQDLLHTGDITPPASDFPA